MSIKELSEREKPREKLLRQGAKFLSDAELLSILFGSGTAKQDVLTIARNLLKEFGGVHRVLHARQKELCRVSGVGPARFALVHACVELVQRSLFEKLQEEDVLLNSKCVREYLSLRLRKQESEVFACLFLNNQHCVIAYEELFFGTINGTNVHPREVVKRALHYNAAAVILVHNHPSGCSEPSQSDKQITQELKHSLGLIDVSVLDHFIVGDTITSFAEEDLL